MSTTYGHRPAHSVFNHSWVVFAGINLPKLLQTNSINLFLIVFVQIEMVHLQKSNFVFGY